MSTRTPLSEAGFDAWARTEGVRYELSEGELVMTASARPLHNRVRDDLGISLASHCKAHGLGTVYWEQEFALADDVIRIPDLSFVGAEKDAQMDLDARPHAAPDLAVEVVSPSNDAADLAGKVRQFLHAGARQVWVLYPKARLAYIYRPGERVEIREDGQELDAPELFPGWSIALTELFNAGRPRSGSPRSLPKSQ